METDTDLDRNQRPHSAKIENTILCNNVRIGEKAQIKDCELGAEFEVEAGADLKGERLTAGEEA